jgi:hypothetical protein
MLDDEMLFCATSMLVSAAIASLQWNALALSHQDASILGVMPITRRELVRAKGASLVIFAAAFVGALNALPAILHPPLMVANLPLNLVMLLPLIAARAMSTCMAGAFGFTVVVAGRELLHAVLGRRTFDRWSDAARSTLLFVVLVLVALLPSRLSGGSGWILDRDAGRLVQRPVSWFAAMDATIAGSVLDGVHQPDMPVWRAAEEEQLRTRFRDGVPRLHIRAATGLMALASLVALTCALYLWNSRRLHLLPEEGGGAGIVRLSRAIAAIGRLPGARPATRAGAAFLFRTALDNPQHRLYLIVSTAAGVALLNATAPTPIGDGPAAIHTYQVAAQTLVLTAIIAGFRAIVRTSADERARWTFAVADTGNLAAYRAGVRLAVLSVSIALVLVLFPVHLRAWGGALALRHAVNGAALAWVLVEIACGSVDEPLIATIPPHDAMNTVGVVFLGSIVILVIVLAHIERATLATARSSALFAGFLLVIALYSRWANARNARMSSAAFAADARMWG